MAWGPRDYVQRQRINEESRDHAEHHREPWLADEEALLLLWTPGDEEGLQAAAELLGRTVEACRQHYYEVRRDGSQRRSSRPTRTAPATAPVTPTCPRCGLQHVGEC